MRSLLDALDRHAAERPHAAAVVDPDGTVIPWISIAERAGRVRSFVEQRSEPGTYVGVSLPSGSAFWCAVLGVASAGRIPSLLPSPVPGMILARLARELRGAMILDGAALTDAGREPSRSAGHREARGVVLLSSGTTGYSRFVLRSSEAIDAIASTLVEEELAVRSDIVASFLPMSHAYGFEHAFLAPLLVGSCVRALGAFSLDAANGALADGATSLPLVPFTAEVLAAGMLAPPKIRCAVLAGSPLPPSVRARVERAFGIGVVDLYGATELGTIWLDRGDGGRPVRGVEIVLSPMAPKSDASHDDGGNLGEILVRSPGMLEAILSSNGESNGVKITGTVDGFFHTGDLGRIDANGRYAIAGRVKLVFDVGGLKVNPIEVEQALETHPAIRRALVRPIEAGRTLRRVGATIELGRGLPPPSFDDVRRHLASLVPAHAIPRVIDVVETLPCTSSGKLLREQQPMTMPPVTRRPKGLESRARRETFTDALFDKTAYGYDNSSGVAFMRSGRWYRRRMLLRSGLMAGSAHLDVGSGTGLCAAIAAEIVGPTGRVVSLDPSAGMREVARRRGLRETVEGRAEKLPFPDASFDVVSMSYMLRHVDDLLLAFHEARRVLRPGGRIMILEVTRPERLLHRYAFDVAMRWMVPSLGVIASGRPRTFPMMRYWAETVEVAARPERIEEALGRSGFVGTRHLLELGVFSCYRGIAPPV